MNIDIDRIINEYEKEEKEKKFYADNATKIKKLKFKRLKKEFIKFNKTSTVAYEILLAAIDRAIEYIDTDKCKKYAYIVSKFAKNFKKKDNDLLGCIFSIVINDEYSYKNFYNSDRERDFNSKYSKGYEEIIDVIYDLKNTFDRNDSLPNWFKFTEAYIKENNIQIPESNY